MRNRQEEDASVSCWNEDKQLFRRSVDVVVGLMTFSDVCAALGALMPSDMALRGGGGGGLGAVELLLIMVADVHYSFMQLRESNANNLDLE